MSTSNARCGGSGGVGNQRAEALTKRWSFFHVVALLFRTRRKVAANNAERGSREGTGGGGGAPPRRKQCSALTSTPPWLRCVQDFAARRQVRFGPSATSRRTKSPACPWLGRFAKAHVARNHCPVHFFLKKWRTLVGDLLPS